MDKYDVMPERMPHSVYYIAEFISEEDAARIKRHVEGAKRWKFLRGRAVQMFGGMPPQPSKPNDRLIREPIPSWLQTGVLNKIEDFVANTENVACSTSGRGRSGHHAEDEIAARICNLNHVLVNAYESDGGIDAHEDGPVYENAAVILSLGDTVRMDFVPTATYQCRDARISSSSLPTSSAPISEAFSIALEPRSLLLFTGRAYTDFTHGIQPTRVHAIGDVVNFDRIDPKNINHPKNDTCEARHDSDDDARDNGSNGASDDDKLQDRTQSGPIHSYRHFRCGRRLSLTCRRVKKELIARMTMNTLIRL